MEAVDAGVLVHAIPGGMISNLRSQLAQQGALDRLPEVLAELPKTRADMGYPPLVTPTSQIVGVQSVLNVLSGKRYSMVTDETKHYAAGYYALKVEHQWSPAMKELVRLYWQLKTAQIIRFVPSNELEKEAKVSPEAQKQLIAWQRDAVVAEVNTYKQLINNPKQLYLLILAAICCMKSNGCSSTTSGESDTI